MKMEIYFIIKALDTIIKAKKYFEKYLYSWILYER